MRFRLAEHLHKTVRELDYLMDSRELSEWGAYFSIKRREEIEEEMRQNVRAKLEANRGNYGKQVKSSGS